MSEATAVVTINMDEITPNPFEVRAEIVEQGSAAQCLWQGLSLSEGALTAGFWEGETCVLDIAAYPHHEIFFVTEGWIRLEDASGTREVLPGQSAYVPKGWAGKWHTVGKTRKHYVILQNMPAIGPDPRAA